MGLRGLLLLALVVAPRPALAQDAMVESPIAISVITVECLQKKGSKKCETPKPKPDLTLRKFCRKTWRERDAFLAKVAQREIDASEILATVQAFQFGERGCQRRPEFATQVLDTAVGNPVTYEADQHLLHLTANWAVSGSLTPKAGQARIAELEHAFWLMAGVRANEGVPWPVAEQKQFLAQSANWQYAMTHLDRNDEPTRLAVAMLWDKDSPTFDPQYAVTVVEQSHSPLVVARTAKELLTGKIIPRNELRARRLLESMRLNFDFPEAIEAHYLLQKLKFDDLRHPDFALRDAALRVMQAKGEVDEIAMMRVVNAAPTGISEPIPSLAERAKAGGMLELAALPPSLTLRDGFITPDDYPSSARRNEEDGLIATWVVFRPDGEPGWLQLAGGTPALRAELARILYRRRFRNFKLAGYAGRYVRAPLVSVWFRLSAECEGEGPPPIAVDGVTIVEAKQFCVTVTSRRR